MFHSEKRLCTDFLPAHSPCKLHAHFLRAKNGGFMLVWLSFICGLLAICWSAYTWGPWGVIFAAGPVLWTTCLFMALSVPKKMRKRRRK